MRKDHRPYILKRLDILWQVFYVNHFLRPQFERLGKVPVIMKPWHVEVFGGPVCLGDYPHIIATPDDKVRFTVWPDKPDKGFINIGDYCLICPGVRISAATEINIGNSCMLAQGVFITDADWHGVYDRSISVGRSLAVRIGDNVWIGDSAIIGKGVTIGENSIIGAGAVVVRDVPANVIAAGNPAIIVKTLDKDKHIKTRAEWFADPEYLADQFDVIDRRMLKGNSWLGWIRAMVFPQRGD